MDFRVRKLPGSFIPKSIGKLALIVATVLVATITTYALSLVYNADSVDANVTQARDGSHGWTPDNISSDWNPGYSSSQTPFLLISRDNKPGRSFDGFDRPILYLSVWIPVKDTGGNDNDLSNYDIDTYDLCNSSSNIDTGSPSTPINVSVRVIGKDSAGDTARSWIFSSTGSQPPGHVTSPASVCSGEYTGTPIDIHSSKVSWLNPIHVRKLYAKGSTNSIDFKQYLLEFELKNNSSRSFYNNFRIKLKKTGGGAVASEPYVVADTSIELAPEWSATLASFGNRGGPDNNFGVGAGNWPTGYSNAWDTTKRPASDVSFVIAPDAERYGCEAGVINEPSRNFQIGLYDSDRSTYDHGNNLTGYPFWQANAGTYPEVEVYETDRPAPGSTPSFPASPEMTLRFDGILNDNDNDAGNPPSGVNVVEVSAPRVTGSEVVANNRGGSIKRVAAHNGDLATRNADGSNSNPGNNNEDLLQWYFRYENNRTKIYSDKNPNGKDVSKAFMVYNTGPGKLINALHKPSSAGDFRPFLYHGGIVNNNFYFYVPDGVGGSSLSSSGVQHAIKNENGEWGYTRNIYSTYNDALGVDPIVYTNNEINTHIANQYNENDVRRIYHRADRLVNKDDWDNLVSGNSSSQNPYYIAVSSNEWENKIIENFFKKDKVYKITFKNIDPRNFVQYRVPFDYINTVATCDQKVEIGITERTCEIYIKQLLFEEYEDPSIRDKIKFELKVHNQSSRTPPGGSINNFTYTNSGLTSPVTPRAVNYGAGHDADALPTPGNALPGQPNGFYSQIPDPDNPPPQDDRLMVRLMLYNQMIYNNNLLTSNRLDNGIILTGRAWLETEDLNNNGVLDLNEDFNNNGSLDTSPITWQVPGLSKKVYDIIPDDPIRGLPRSYMDCLDFTTPTVISGPDTDGMPNCAVWIEDVSMPISSTGEANLHLEITQSGSDAGPVTYTNGDPDVDIHDLILKKDQDPNNYDYGSYTNAVRVSSYDRVLDTDPSSTLSSSPPNRRYHLFDITDASTAWFTTPRHLTYEIAGYYDSSGELREFDTPLPRAAVNLSGLAVNQAACEDAPPGECWSWNWPEGLDWDDNDIDITSRSGTYNRTATDSFTSSKEGASQTFSHTHRDYNIYNESGSHYHGTGSGNKVYDSVYGHTGPANTTHSHSWSEDLPDTVQTDSGTYNQVSTVTDNIKIHFSTFDNSAFDDDFVQDYLVEKIFLNNDYSDTSTSEIGSNHTVRIQLKFDNGPSSHLDTLFAAPPDYAELTTSNGDNLSINSTSSIDKRFSITAQRVRRAGSTSWARTGSSASNNSVLSLIDGGSITTPDIHTYEWRISWRLEIEETITYTYAYDNTTRHSWSDSAYWDSTSPNGNHYYNSTSNLSTTETIKNLLTFNGTWEACSRVLVVRPPDCSIRRKDPLFNHPESGRDEERIPPSNNPTKVYPVGEPDQRTVFTMINRQNYFDLVTTSSTHPTYNVNSQTGRFHSPGVSISQSTANTVATIPSGQSLDFEESFTSIVYPGEFLVTWNPAWESDAQGVATPGTHPSWQGLEHTGNSCTTGPTSINIFVWADPPECIVRRDVFEKDDPNTRITVELVNPNAASMDIDSIRYEVTNQHDPSFTPPVSGFIPTSHPNDSIDPNGRRVISTRTGPPNDLQRVLQRDGEYNFEWSIVTSMGGESWTTLDYALTSTQQNSWFESINERITSEGSDPNERRTGYPFPGNSSHGTIPCTEQVRVAVKPYFKVFHGDVGAGGYFGLANKYDSCGVNNETVIRNSSGTIDGFIFGHSSGNDYSTAKGSSVQYGVQAHNAIAYFYSASQRPASPTPLKGLSFSNTAGNPDWGGDFGETSCISNYWREVENIHEEPNPGGHTPIDIDLSTIRNNDRKRYVLNYGQNLNIDGFGVNLSDLKATLFVEGEGNVYINSDIVNENTAGWNDRSEVGYLLIVVRGNIYIDPSVNRIDAVLVAYPDHINTGINRALAGEIWTCYYPGIDASSHYTSCNSDLIVNGALIAQRVRLGRINNSVIRATTPETPTLILPTNAFDIANRLGGSYNRGSEEINLRPEFLIGVPELPLFPDQLYKSDSITVTPVNY